MSDHEELIDHLRRINRSINSLWNLLFIGIVLPLWIGVVILASQGG